VEVDFALLAGFLYQTRLLVYLRVIGGTRLSAVADLSLAFSTGRILVKLSSHAPVFEESRVTYKGQIRNSIQRDYN
jgi:hypothetical protein